jgi:hypothetical protein
MSYWRRSMRDTVLTGISLDVLPPAGHATATAVPGGEEEGQGMSGELVSLTRSSSNLLNPQSLILATVSPSCVVAGSVERHATAASIVSIVAVKPNRHEWHGVSGRALLLLAGREERGNGNWPIASGVSRRLDLALTACPATAGKGVSSRWIQSRITMDLRNLEKVDFLNL